MLWKTCCEQLVYGPNRIYILLNVASAVGRCCALLLWIFLPRDTRLLVSRVRPRNISVTQHLMFAWQQMLSWVSDGALSQIGGRLPLPDCSNWRRFKMFHAWEVSPKRAVWCLTWWRRQPELFFYFVQPVARTWWVHELWVWKWHCGYLTFKNPASYI